QGILLGTCMLLIPAYTGVRLSTERSDTNVDLLFISTLRPRAIIAGKFFAAIVLILLIFSACTPFMTFTYLMRGLDIPTILLVLAIDLLVVLAGTQLALFFGTITTNRPLKGLLGLLGLLGLILLFGVTMVGTLELIERGSIRYLTFWTMVGPASGVLAAI